MLEVVIAILVCYGMSNIIVQGSIFYPFKEWLEEYIPNTKYRFIEKILSKFYTLINCPMCTGFWVGAICGIFLGPFVWWNLLFNGCLYSGTTWLLWCFAQKLGQGEDPAMTHNIVFGEDSKLNINNKE